MITILRTQFWLIWANVVGKYDQEIPQSHTIDQPKGPRGSATEH